MSIEKTLESMRKDIADIKLILSSIKFKERRNRERKVVNPEHKRSCKKWEVEEVDQLVKLYEKGKSLDDIAKLHERTVGAISARLAQMGYLFYDKQKQEYRKQTEYLSYDESTKEYRKVKTSNDE